MISLSPHLRTPSSPPPPPFSPSLISRTVSVEVKHHVYLIELRSFCLPAQQRLTTGPHRLTAMVTYSTPRRWSILSHPDLISSVGPPARGHGKGQRLHLPLTFASTTCQVNWNRKCSGKRYCLGEISACSCWRWHCVRAQHSGTNTTWSRCLGVYCAGLPKILSKYDLPVRF